jgi:hypothetical protein
LVVLGARLAPYTVSDITELGTDVIYLDCDLGCKEWAIRMFIPMYLPTHQPLITIVTPKGDIQRIIVRLPFLDLVIAQYTLDRIRRFSPF